MTSGRLRRRQFVVSGDERAVVLVVDGGVEVVIWRFSPQDRADLGVIDRLARLQLAARRCGWSIRLREPCPGLSDLVDFVGLADVLPLEAGRELEGGEEIGVEEVVQPRDPPP